MNKSTCLKLIKLFESHRLLWDPLDTHFYNKELKEHAWRDIGYKLNLPAKEIKRKVTNLRGVLRKERFRKRQCVADGEQYESRWFAFKPLSFLEDMRMNRSKDTQDEPRTSAATPISVKLEQITEAETDSNLGSDKEESDTHNSDFDEPLEQAIAWVPDGDDIQEDQEEINASAPKKRKTNLKLNIPPKKAKRDEHIQKTYDVYETFGNLVASELRKYSFNTLAHVKKAIMDVIFQADIGKLPGTTMEFNAESS